MERKTITVTEDAYERLVAFKGDGESFSEAILRLTDHHGDPLEIVGAWEGTDYGAVVEEGIAEFEESMGDRDDTLFGT